MGARACAHARAHRGRGGAGRGPPCAAKKKNNKIDVFLSPNLENIIDTDRDIRSQKI